MCHFTEEYEAYIKTQEVMYKTVTTAVVQEPKVADVPPVVVSEYDIQRRMAQQAQIVQTFITERVMMIFRLITPVNSLQSQHKANIKYPVLLTGIPNLCFGAENNSRD